MKSRGDGDEKERELECEGERSPEEREQSARGGRGLRFGGFLPFLGISVSSFAREEEGE